MLGVGKIVWLNEHELVEAYVIVKFYFRKAIFYHFDFPGPFTYKMFWTISV